MKSAVSGPVSEHIQNKGGRPRKEMTDEEFDRVIGMIRIQCTAEEIAGVLSVSSDTLDRRIKERGEIGFAELYKKHASFGKASLRRLQWRAAEAGNPTMLIWLGKQVLGQSDKQAIEHTGAGGGPIQTEDVTKRDADDFTSRILRLAARAAEGGDAGDPDASSAG